MTAPTLLAQPEHQSLVDQMPLDDYLAVDALSAGSARKMLPPSCPALYRQDRETPQRSKSLDLGKVAHAVVLEGVDLAEIVVEVRGDWRTNAAKNEVRVAQDNGLIPLHTKDVETVRGMVAGIRRNAMAAALLDPDTGKPEQSMFWTNEQTGVPRKGRLDFLPERRASGRLIVPDYKTAASAEPSEWARSAVNYGYHQQADGYREGIRTLGLDDEPQLLFIVQETRPPYLVTVNELDDDAMSIARELNRWACQEYARCIESGRWPGYPGEDEVQQISLPAWYVREHKEMT